MESITTAEDCGLGVTVGSTDECVAGMFHDESATFSSLYNIAKIASLAAEESFIPERSALNLLSWFKTKGTYKKLHEMKSNSSITLMKDFTMLTGQVQGLNHSSFIYEQKDNLAADCDKVPKGFNLAKCCKLPVLEKDYAVKLITDQFRNQRMSEVMFECKSIEAIFKEYNIAKDEGIDKEALLKTIEEKVLEPIWKPIIKAAAEECYEDIMEERDEIVKELEMRPFNIGSDECNVIYMSLLTCIQLEAFDKCPQDHWVNSESCNEARKWNEECGETVDSLNELGALKKS
ncbi:CLUMA_CG019786, isoform A [Clunio marinus]|uniref:CLUMA_CG019786, isoform A n=1 Tax=Clunio marinus TaxID=568069 RepID=A0A1J1J453_9DIPT|nr:CLUMA_CG019786, isoform A [Clunio marinus]